MTPIVRATLAFAAGILAASYGRAALPGGPLLFVAIAMAATVAWLRRSDARTRHAYATALGFLLAGAAAGHVAGARAEADCAARLPADAAATFVGVLEALPVEGVTVPLRVGRVVIGGQSVPCRTTLRVRARTTPPDSTSVPLAVHGRWRTFSDASRWPQRPARRGVIAADSIALAPPPGGAVGTAGKGGYDAGAAGVLLTLRLSAQQRVRRLYPREWPLAEALVLARREGLPPATRDRFVAAGLAHLLAISGTHVALFAGALLLAARIVRLPLAAAYAAAALGSVAYVLLLGAPHAAARAALQLLLFLGTRLAQRAIEPVSAVALAALLLLAFDPLALLDPGFQLSFAGVLGIVRCRRPILDALPRSAPRWLRDAIATGVAASLTTTPIAGLHFQHVSMIGVLSGVVALPVLAVTVPALALTLLLEPVAPAAAAFLARGAALLLRVLDAIAAAAAAVPGGHAYVRPVAVLGAVAAALAFVLLRRHAASRRRDRGGGSEAAALRSGVLRDAALAAAIALLLPPLWARAAADGVDIFALDVGQGDALVVRSPAGRWIVVDAGPASASYDAGARLIVPFLRRHGARRVDALVLSHPHADHIGGAPAVLDAFDVRVVVDPGVAAASAYYHASVAAASRNGASWIAARPGTHVRVDGVLLEFLHPDEIALDALTDPNDYSAVFRLGYGRFAALFLGDAPIAIENALVREYAAALGSQVLKVGHHGSRTSTGDSLLASVAPTFALISAGRRNRYGHPAPEVMDRLARHGVRTLRTDSAGTVRLRGRANGEVRIVERR